MLKKLFVQNYALIESLEIEFSSGFSVITGETGSGKSILVGALSLILGERADHKVLYNKDKKCVIEGFFKSNRWVQALLNLEDIELEDELILRREIRSNGKSRNFVNDSPVKLDFLKKIGNLLIDFHGQNQTQLLSQSNYQYSFIDSAANTIELRKEYFKLFNRYQKKKDQLNELYENEKNAENQKDYLSFQLNELNKYSFENWDEKSIDEEYNLLSNIDDIKQIYNQINELSNGRDSILVKLEEIQNLINQLSKMISTCGDYLDRVKSIHIELKDILVDLSRKFPQDQENPIRKEELSEQIHVIKALTKKFNVSSLNDLVYKKNEIEDKLSEIENLSNDRLSIENELKTLKKECVDSAYKLHHSRSVKIVEIEKYISETLSKLSMPDAHLKIELKVVDEEPHRFGIDCLNIFISTNKGGKFYLINEIASGGELSRIMLSMKSLLTIENSVSTIIFDEIDSGVSGKVANEIGILLKELSSRSQVLCITHLPQVASMGQFHYNVIKEMDESRTYSKIRLLNKEERLIEIANMLGGTRPGKAALDNAAELLN